MTTDLNMPFDLLVISDLLVASDHGRVSRRGGLGESSADGCPDRVTCS